MATSTCFAGDVNQVRTMLCRVASSEAVVKSQQRSEPELTVDKKVDILQEMFEKKPTSFLMRFGRYLAREDLRNFEHLRGDYEIDFRLNEVKNIIDSKKTKTGIRNRRYECLQRLMKDSDYFSEENMRKRSPLLYEEYIGQYLTEEEKLDRDRAEMGADPCLSELIMNRQEKEMNDWLLDYQRDQEACVQEEEDDSDMESDTNQGDLYLVFGKIATFGELYIKLFNFLTANYFILCKYYCMFYLFIYLLLGSVSKTSHYSF